MVERRGAQGAVGEGGELVVKAAPDDVQVNHMCGLGYRPGAAALGKRGLARRRSSGQAAAHLDRAAALDPAPAIKAELSANA